MSDNISEKLRQLRSAMQEQQIAAYLIPSSDPHQSEYVAPHWQIRQWLSGFTGSAGMLVITADHAGLWTDSRYFLQAEQELANNPFVLHRQKVPHAPEHITWLADHLPAGAQVGLDGYLFSVDQVRHLERQLQEKKIKVLTDVDLISAGWPDRPPLPTSTVFAHELRYAGQSREDKLQQIREAMNATGADYYLLTTLDDIAWTLNLRAGDVDYNPVAIAYLLIGQERSVLFTDDSRITEELHNQLDQAGVDIQAYDRIVDHLRTLRSNSRIRIDESTISFRLFEAIPTAQRLPGDNIPRRLKACKNDTEIQHIRRVMVRDGVALLRVFRWLEKQLQQGEQVTEAEVAQRLHYARSQQDHYVGESFSAIVGYQANGAIVHYRPHPESSAVIRPEGILLVDSGGQYLDGTTDITRTIALGPPTDEQRRHFTLVLRGYIALETIQFPQGTSGGQLDVLARQYLWKQGLDYGHGTGHGVGFFLNVHEPPQGFAPSVTTSRGSSVFQAGMLTSNEPGFYLTGAYGIRIENLILCVQADTTDFGEFLAFEPLTLFPIDHRLIDPAMLSPAELRWLNNYHRKVFDQLSPYLTEAETDWLAVRCTGQIHLPD